VLVWGSAAALACSPLSCARPPAPKSVGVVSSEEKGKLVMRLGASGTQPSTTSRGMIARASRPQEENARFQESRRFSNGVREILGTPRPRQSSSSTRQGERSDSVFVVKPFGKGRHLPRSHRYNHRLRRPLTCGCSRRRSSARTSANRMSPMRPTAIESCTDPGRPLCVRWALKTPARQA